MELRVVKYFSALERECALNFWRGNISTDKNIRLYWWNIFSSKIGLKEKCSGWEATFDITVCSLMWRSVKFQSLVRINTRMYQWSCLPINDKHSLRLYQVPPIVWWCWVMSILKGSVYKSIFNHRGETSSLCQITISVDSWKLIDVDGTRGCSEIIKVNFFSA